MYLITQSAKFLKRLYRRSLNCCLTVLREFCYPFSTLADNVHGLSHLQRDGVITIPWLHNDEMCVSEPYSRPEVHKIMSSDVFGTY